MIKNTVLLTALVAVALSSPATAQELSRSDQLRMAVQEICPVSGQRLGEHGKPLKVKIGGEVVFLCCQPCSQGKVDRIHWATIHANFARAQRICPIMKHELPEKPKWALVEGRVVYYCCPPCADEIAQKPSEILSQVDELYFTALESRAPKRR